MEVNIYKFWLAAESILGINTDTLKSINGKITLNTVDGHSGNFCFINANMAVTADNAVRTVNFSLQLKISGFIAFAETESGSFVVTRSSRNRSAAQCT